jgi:transaldolase
MKIFIDTANVNDIRTAYEYGTISGVTTNPSLIAKEGKKFADVIKEIASIVDGPINAEVIGLTSDEMIGEGRALAKYHNNIVVKIPMCLEGLKAVKVLSSEGISTNVTLVFSAGQALLAANAGATYVSSFLGRLDDVGNNAMYSLKEIVEIFKTQRLQTKVIVASVRNPVHVIEAAKTGVDIATVPYNVIMQMANHPLTSNGIEKFLQDWETLRAK